MAVYQLAFLLGLCLYSPILLWRSIVDSRYRRSFRQRTGRVQHVADGRPIVWIHGVSVGEIKAAGNIIARLRVERPDLQIVLSSTTPNGHQVARQDHPDLQVVFYPLDFWLWPARALDRIRPQCVLLMDLEIWPNFLQAAARRGVPVAVINGRISERTFHGYRRAKGLLPQLDRIRLFCVQNNDYQQRLLDLGVDPATVVVTGNMKYDSVAMGTHAEAGAMLRRWLAAPGRLVLIAGSTHAEEEVMVCNAAAAHPGCAGIRIVVVPRHPERSAAVVDSLRSSGRLPVRWSETQDGTLPLAENAVLVVDAIGHLQKFYAAGDIAFVGGSLIPHGGQNMLEPAAQGRAVVFGPHTTNFRTDVDLLLQEGAAICVADAQALGVELARLCSDASLRGALGARGQAVIARNQGATARTLARLRDVLG